MMKEVRESKPEVGSSNIKTHGSLISSKAMEVRLRYPPEIPLIKPKESPPIKVSAHFYSLNYLIRSSTFLSLNS